MSTWTEDHYKKADALWRRGISQAAIAKRFNISVNSVAGRIHRARAKGLDLFPVRTYPTIIKHVSNPSKTADERKRLKLPLKAAKTTQRVLLVSEIKGRVSIRKGEGYVHLDGQNITPDKKYAWRGKLEYARRIISRLDGDGFIIVNQVLV